MATHGTGLPTTVVLENIKGRALNYDPKTSRVIPILIDSTATDAGNTPTTTLRAGLPMAQIRASDNAKYRRWLPMDTTANGAGNGGLGLAFCEGILASDVNMKDAAGVVQNSIGFLLVGGVILETDIKVDHGMGTAGTVLQVLHDLGIRRGTKSAVAGAGFDRPAETALELTNAIITNETNVTVIPGATALA